MSIESDLAAIDAAILSQRIGLLAASARAARSEVESYEPDELYDYRRADHVLESHGLRRVPAPSRTLEATPLPRKPLWRHRWVRVTAGFAVVIVILSVVTDLASAALGISASTLIIMASAAVVLFCYLEKGMPVRWSGKSKGGNEQGGGQGLSQYDGRPLRTYCFRAERDGRQVTVLSSWRPGDPGR